MWKNILNFCKVTFNTVRLRELISRNYIFATIKLFKHKNE